MKIILALQQIPLLRFVLKYGQLNITIELINTSTIPKKKEGKIRNCKKGKVEAQHKNYPIKRKFFGLKILQETLGFLKLMILRLKVTT